MTLQTSFRATLEFHVARSARDFYQFDRALYQLSGNVVFADFHAARVFAQKMNDKRDVARHPERTVRTAEINAMALIDEVLHYIFAMYRQQVNPGVMQQALAYLGAQLGADGLEQTLRHFGSDFPASPVYRGEIELELFMQGATDGYTHREMTLEELLMLWLANMNPAFRPYHELFDDGSLHQQTAYLQIMTGLQEFFRDQPAFGEGGESIIDVLRAPALASPDSLEGQLAFLARRWGVILGPQFLRLLRSQDFLSEEYKPAFWGPGPIQAIEFGGEVYQEEFEQYSRDLHWMPRLVLLAKNAYVWLDQLSKKYGRPITTLDQIPDEELDTLQRWGITGFWLIGLWERSQASRRIKQMMGNPEAVASAYSLYDYSIADDLGGTEAMDNLRQRAWQRGIRMASDMVPNHMAIDSRWVMHIPTGFFPSTTAPSPPTPSTGPTCAATSGWASTSKTTTTRATMPLSFSSVTTTGPAIRVTSTTATTAPTCPGTTLPSSTTSAPRCARLSSRPFSTSPASSPSSASMPP